MDAIERLGYKYSSLDSEFNSFSDDELTNIKQRLFVLWDFATF